MSLSLFDSLTSRLIPGFKFPPPKHRERNHAWLNLRLYRRSQQPYPRSSSRPLCTWPPLIKKNVMSVNLDLSQMTSLDSRGSQLPRKHLGREEQVWVPEWISASTARRKGWNGCAERHSDSTVLTEQQGHRRQRSRRRQG